MNSAISMRSTTTSWPTTTVPMRARTPSRKRTIVSGAAAPLAEPDAFGSERDIGIPVVNDSIAY